MLKGIAGIIWRVYASALYLACKILLKSLQRKEVIAIDKHVATALVTERPLLVFNQYARLQPRLILLAYPRKFELLGFSHSLSPNTRLCRDRYALTSPSFLAAVYFYQ